MKLPPVTAALALSARRGVLPATVNGPGSYRVVVCTVNLGATGRRSGHPVLKHCFARIEDENGEAERTLAFGRAGVASEPYPELVSVRCEVQATGLSAAEKERFVGAFNACEARGYQWGANDCCSCVGEAVRTGLGGEPLALVSEAAADLARSPEVL